MAGVQDQELFDETNTATGLVAEKGGEYVVCPDCSKESCLGCHFVAHPLRRNSDVWCAKLGKYKTPWLVCEHYMYRPNVEEVSSKPVLPAIP